MSGTDHDITLFRREAIDAKRAEPYGRVVIIRPVAFSVYTGFALACALALACIMIFFSYTRRTQVAGLLVPDTGLVRVVAPHAGLLVEQHVVEGQRVKKGAVLFVLSDPSAVAGPSQKGVVEATAAIGMTFTQRRRSLVAAQAAQEQSSAQQSRQLEAKIDGLAAELGELSSEIATAQAREKSTRGQFDNLDKLASEHYVPTALAQQKQDEMLDQRVRIDELQRTRLAMQRDIDSSRNDLEQIRSKAELQKAQSNYSLSELQQNDLTAGLQSRVLITAPTDGIATGILAQAGQTVSAGAILTIVPVDAVMEANLYVPEHAAGFVSPGQRVHLRYTAFPYQKFGQYDGTVVSVSRSALVPEELPPQYSAQAQRVGGEGFYLLKVRLARQSITAYGKQLPLTAGMQLQADILQDRRTLLGWVLEPLYTLRGQYAK